MCCTASNMVLDDMEQHLVSVAFNSMNPNAEGVVALREIYERFNAVEHPRVKEGVMAPGMARDRLLYLFGSCANEHDGGITFDEFMTFHHKLIQEAWDERVSDVQAFIRQTIMRLWRLGNLLLPTGIRPAFPIDQTPRALYATMLMTLLWAEKDPRNDGKFIIKGIKDVVRPIFRRGDLPDELQGHFAYPSETSDLAVEYLPTQIAIKRWLDFVWEYDKGKYCGVQGIVSAQVDLDVLPPSLRQFIVEHSTAVEKLRCEKFVKTSISENPMYKCTNQVYGVGSMEECRKVHQWKAKSLMGKQYGIQFYGLQKGIHSKMGPTICHAATRINL
ncbi:unnamed protein product [Phytomonas sp. EM1]|nr:unnamed protein product [Phytomonas sp. EM1]|eukprot:CCW60102.1 unnamed protein product [Phytomonas sp. isolate EM1]